MALEAGNWHTFALFDPSFIQAKNNPCKLGPNPVCKWHPVSWTRYGWVFPWEIGNMLKTIENNRKHMEHHCLKISFVCEQIPYLIIQNLYMSLSKTHKPLTELRYWPWFRQSISSALSLDSHIFSLSGSGKHRPNPEFKTFKSSWTADLKKDVTLKNIINYIRGPTCFTKD